MWKAPGDYPQLARQRKIVLILSNPRAGRPQSRVPGNVVPAGEIFPPSRWRRTSYAAARAFPPESQRELIVLAVAQRPPAPSIPPSPQCLHAMEQPSAATPSAKDNEYSPGPMHLHHGSRRQMPPPNKSAPLPQSQDALPILPPPKEPAADKPFPAPLGQPPQAPSGKHGCRP